MADFGDTKFDDPGGHLRRILSTRHGDGITRRIFDGIADATIRFPGDPMAPVMGAAVGMIAGHLDRRRTPALDIQQRELRLALSVADMVVDDDASLTDLERETSRLIVDRMLSESDANAAGVTTSLAADSKRGLTMADVVKAMDALRATLPPWHVFWDQTEVIVSAWLDDKTGGYVLDRAPVDDTDVLGRMPADQRRYAVLVHSDVKAAFAAAGIDDRDLGAMCVWRARNDRVAKYGAEAWPLDDAGRPADILKDPWPGAINPKGS